jgi:hypothetical protein
MNSHWNQTNTEMVSAPEFPKSLSALMKLAATAPRCDPSCFVHDLSSTCLFRFPVCAVLYCRCFSILADLLLRILLFFLLPQASVSLQVVVPDFPNLGYLPVPLDFTKGILWPPEFLPCVGSKLLKHSSSNGSDLLSHIEFNTAEDGRISLQANFEARPVVLPSWKVFISTAAGYLSPFVPSCLLLLNLTPIRKNNHS